MFEDRIDEAFAALGVASPSLLRTDELTGSLQMVSRAKGFAAWAEYATVAEMHRQLAAPSSETDLLQLDGWAQCSARIGAALNVTPGAADSIMRRGIALRDRLPHVNDALKAGRVSPHHIPDIVSRTELVDGMPWSDSVDGEIAEMLWRDGSWSFDRMRNMVDQIVFRHDPEGVRERRARAREGRNFKRYPTEDGMADIFASMTAENALLLDKRVQELAARVCKDDPRTTPQRLSDALFCATMDVQFICECGNSEGCEFARVDDVDDSNSGHNFVIHVVMDQATAEGKSANPGFVDGHGVISGEHALELAQRSDARVRPVGGDLSKPSATQTDRGDLDYEQRLSTWKRLITAKRDAKEPAPDQDDRSDESDQSEGPIKAECQAPPPSDPGPATGHGHEGHEHSRPPRWVRRGQTRPLPKTQRANPYRPSTALAVIIRIRDGYCVFPGCGRPAWKSELDHTEEYNHDDPATGGQTSAEGIKCLCKFHHLLKSFGDWIDIQEVDENGRIRITFISPEGVRFHGPAWTGEDLFPEVTNYRWQSTASPPNNRPTMPNRPRTRLADKHARRRAERARNLRRNQAATDSGFG
ncbi:HNH endonuclease signature motif containing protein [Nocardia sp. 348MFTsu5.1]|uniref:HNH endonuclease signature motif containing protein n=1 Tax=Nocardia sp. 348MFTsu5.1 TaxID=1172185 RepID=UPI0003604552|nr:HNH endonuclease signature motif containing protein [Nocardia sp. 348MFTsu5.1]